MTPLSTLGWPKGTAPSCTQSPGHTPVVVGARPSDDLAFGAVDWFMYAPSVKPAPYHPRRRVPPVTTRLK